MDRIRRASAHPLLLNNSRGPPTPYFFPSLNDVLSLFAILCSYWPLIAFRQIELFITRLSYLLEFINYSVHR